MASSFTGRYRYKDIANAAEQSGSCRVVVEDQNLQVLPDKGSPIALDLGDIDEYIPGDYELTLRVYDGSLLVLSHFAKTYQNLTHDLLAAYRDRTIQCLLLEDLEEAVRIEGNAQLDSPEFQFSCRSEIRLYGSNLAILPERATGMQWRLADIDSIAFDEADHALHVRSCDDRLILGKLAKRTGEFEKFLKSSMSNVSEKSARVIQRILPFLSPGQFQRLAAILMEGRAANIREMEAIHPKIGQALAEQTVSVKLQPYFEALRQRSIEPGLYSGFKLIREEPEADDVVAGTVEISEAGTPLEESQPAETDAPSVIHWYFFPICGDRGELRNLVAWEVVSSGGRATYFFRLVPKDQEGLLQNPDQAPSVLKASIRRLNRALVLLNFRREPIYLKDESLEMQPQYRRYAIACRKMPVLRQLRNSFLGRALHTSIQDWEEQVQKILANA